MVQYLDTQVLDREINATRKTLEDNKMSEVARQLVLVYLKQLEDERLKRIKV